MKRYQVIILLVIISIFIIVTLALVSREKNPLANDDSQPTGNTNTNSQSVSAIEWQTITFNQEGLAYLLQIPEDWEEIISGFYSEEGNDWLREEHQILTNIRSPKYDTNFQVMPSSQNFGESVSIMTEYYNNDRPFDDWYIEHRQEFMNPMSDLLVKEETLNIQGKTSKVATLSGVHIIDPINNTGLPTLTYKVFIPLPDKVLEVTITAESWLMDHFQETVDTIITSIKVD